jgi:hypothetical protein
MARKNGRKDKTLTEATSRVRGEDEEEGRRINR